MASKTTTSAAKLTLSMPRNLIRDAKRMAAEEGTSVSSMVRRYLRERTDRRRQTDDIPITPAVKAISGIVKLPDGKTWDDVLFEAIMEKHGPRK